MRPDPIPELKQAVGAALARRISGWSSAHDAAALLRTDASRIRDIRRGALKRFSLEMLLRLLVGAGARVEIRVTEPRHAEPHVALIDDTSPRETRAVPPRTEAATSRARGPKGEPSAILPAVSAKLASGRPADPGTAQARDP